MSPLEYELHWERVWNVLMMDVSRALRTELCLPDDLEPIQIWLLESFEDHYRTNEYMSSAGLLSIRLTSTLRSSSDEDKVLHILAWGDYLSDLVHSRVGEFIWSSALFGLDEVEHPEWLGERFRRMQSERIKLNEQTKSALERITFTPRDAKILERINWSEESLLTHCKLIAGYNAFCRMWHRYMKDATAAQLDEVCAFGKALAQKRGIEETQLCYPGIWEAGPQRGLLRLGSS